MRRRNGGFTLVQVMVVLALAVMIFSITSASMSALRWSAQQKEAALEAKRKAGVESAWNTIGVFGPETARVEMAYKIVIGQGVDPATITDWTREGLAARTPSVVTPDWLSPEAVTIMGLEVEGGGS